MLGENLLPSQFNSIVPEVTALGITQGRKSRSWRDIDYEKFKQNEAAGMDPAQNMYETGTYKSFDLKPRQEISSKGSKVLVTPDMADNLNLKMKDVYEHPKLFDAYPHLADMDVHFMDLDPHNHGAFIPHYNTIFVNDKLINDPVALRMLFEHELSHAIQHHEGHGRGGAPSMFPSEKDAIAAKAIDAIMEKQNINANEAAKIHEQITGEKPTQEAIDYANSGQANLTPFTDPHENYRHIVGEIEARLDERRADLSDKALRNYYPMEFHPKQASTGLPGWSNYGIEKSINPDYALIHGGQGTFLTYPEWKRIQELKQKLDQEKTVPLNKLSASMSEVPLTPEQMREELFRKNRESLAKDKEQKAKTEPRTLEQRMKDQAELEDLKKPSVDEMKAAVTLHNPNISWSVKEKGGNWLDRTLNNHLRTLKQGINTSLAPDSFNLAPNWRDTANEIGFTPEHQEEFAKTAALNQFVDRRLSPYIKNEMGTPTDSVRDLADQGISHLQDLQFEPWISESTYDKRRAANMPTEGYAKNDAGKEWEMRTDEAIKNTKAGSAANSPASLEDYPWIRPLANKNPNAPIHAMPNRDEFNELGFDHLMDELRSSLTGNVPQHLALTPKTLERMTMSDAVRHVAKINDYREKQMAKTAAEDIKDFPAVKTYANGDKWHDLKMPITDEVLPKGYEVIKLEDHGPNLSDRYDIKMPNGKTMFQQGDYGLSKDDMDAYLLRNPPGYFHLDRALKNEGDMMGHCVGCYTDEVASGNTKIFTLRDKSNKPHATVEMNVVQPRWEDIPQEVKAKVKELNADHSNTGDDYLKQWVQDNPTVVLNQFKGKQNRPIIEKYRDQALDLLNNPQNVHTIYSITDEGRSDLAGAGIVDRSDTKSVMSTLMSNKLDLGANRMDRYNQIIQQKPDLPRFMSDADFAKLFETKKPEGHKKGGMIEHKITPDYMKLELAMRK